MWCARAQCRHEVEADHVLHPAGKGHPAIGASGASVHPWLLEAVTPQKGHAKCTPKKQLRPVMYAGHGVLDDRVPRFVAPMYSWQEEKLPGGLDRPGWTAEDIGPMIRTLESVYALPTALGEVPRKPNPEPYDWEKDGNPKWDWLDE